MYLRNEGGRLNTGSQNVCIGYGSGGGEAGDKVILNPDFVAGKYTKFQRTSVHLEKAGFCNYLEKISGPTRQVTNQGYFGHA